MRRNLAVRKSYLPPYCRQNSTVTELRFHALLFTTDKPGFRRYTTSSIVRRNRTMRWNRRDFLRAAAAATVAGRMPMLRALNGAADRMSWFHEAKFGMFIHWGPYSVAGIEASWPIMRPTAEITESEYRALPARFNPTLFDPKAWVTLARAAGQRYMVFTAKHCDGFCMFDSDYTSYKITRTPYGKDTARMLADACHAEAMPLGFYYSPPTWTTPASAIPQSLPPSTSMASRNGRSGHFISITCACNLRSCSRVTARWPSSGSTPTCAMPMRRDATTPGAFWMRFTACNRPRW